MVFSLQSCNRFMFLPITLLSWSVLHSIREKFPHISSPRLYCFPPIKMENKQTKNTPLLLTWAMGSNYSCLCKKSPLISSSPVKSFSPFLLNHFHKYTNILQCQSSLQTPPHTHTYILDMTSFLCSIHSKISWSSSLHLLTQFSHL